MVPNVIYHFGLQKYLPSTIEIYKHDWAYSSEKTERELGYTHSPLREGLKQTLDWIYKNRKHSAIS